MYKEFAIVLNPHFINLKMYKELGNCPDKIGDLDIKTLDDLELSGRKVLLRVDVNSPIDKNGHILDSSRLKAHVPTIKELVERKNSVVMISHQGRPGDRDFVELEEHAQVLSKYLDLNVEFIDDVMGPYAREKISNMKEGEVILLNNVRMVAEELIEGPPQQQAKTSW